MEKTKKIIAVMSEWGYWGIELVGPLSKLEETLPQEKLM